MRALLDDLAGIDYEDPVGALDCREPVRDDDGGPPTTNSSMAFCIACSLSESRLDVASSRIRIGRVLDDGPGDGQPLALAAGERRAGFADGCLVIQREPFDEFGGVRGSAACWIRSSA